jgi:hypothetical protein
VAQIDFETRVDKRELHGIAAVVGTSSEVAA